MPPTPDEQLQVVNVAGLPLPNDIDEPACMIGPWVWVRRRIRRLVPWLVPPQGPRGCCRHHQVNWRQAAEVAVRLVRQAHAASSQEIEEYVMNAVRDEDLDEQTETAIILLISPGAGIQPNNDPDDPWRYYDGHHRVAAQLDQGVRQTIIQQTEILDPLIEPPKPKTEDAPRAVLLTPPPTPPMTSFPRRH